MAVAPCSGPGIELGRTEHCDHNTEHQSKAAALGIVPVAQTAVPGTVAVDQTLVVD